MSIKISSEVYDGSGTFFSMWRKEIAVAAELIEDKDELYSSSGKINWDYLAKQTDFLGYWKTHPGDPVWFIIAHNDSDGILTHEHAAELSKRLKDLVPKLSGKDKYPNWQTQTKNIIKGLNKAVKAKEDINFS